MTDTSVQVGFGFMLDPHLENKKSPKYYVKRYLERWRGELAGKTVVDVPAGNGATTEILLEVGAKVKAYDLFPEYFMIDDLECERADIMKGIPMENESADMIICQEGIEHFSDQVKTFKEFNRVLKPGGQLLITTPSYSNLAARLSYFLFESENSKKMPPNEIDDVWMSDKSLTDEIYYGHIFLVGLQKLRVIGKLCGLKIDSIEYVRVSKGSALLFPFLYPLIFLYASMMYRKHMRKDKGVDCEAKKAVYGEQFKINVDPRNLLNRHTFIVFKKEAQSTNVDFRNDQIVKRFDQIM